MIPPHRTDWGKPFGTPPLDADALHKRLAWAITELERRGVRVPPGCRVRNAVRLLEQLREANLRPTRGQEPLRIHLGTAMDQHHTASELFLIMCAAAQCTNDDHPFTNDKLAQIVRGPDSREGRDTSARDTQFELTTAVRLRLCGLDVMAGNPDFTFLLPTSEVVGVEAKRVTSDNVKQLKAALAGAVEQIERTRRRGVIAVNLERKLEGLTGSTEAEEFTAVEGIYSQVFNLAENYADHPRVIGVITVSAVTRPLGVRAPNGLPQLDTFVPWTFTRLYRSRAEQESGSVWLRHWQETFGRNLVHCMASWSPPLNEVREQCVVADQMG